MERSQECADCGQAIPLEHDEPERRPCPVCGSMRRAHFGRLSSSIKLEGSMQATVERGLNDIRLAVLGVLATIGLSVGFGVDGSVWVRLAAGVGSFAVACLLVRWRRTRRLLMEFMHRLTGS